MCTTTLHDCDNRCKKRWRMGWPTLWDLVKVKKKEGDGNHVPFGMWVRKVHRSYLGVTIESANSIGLGEKRRVMWSFSNLELFYLSPSSQKNPHKGGWLGPIVSKKIPQNPPIGGIFTWISPSAFFHVNPAFCRACQMVEIKASTSRNSCRWTWSSSSMKSQQNCKRPN